MSLESKLENNNVTYRKNCFDKGKKNAIKNCETNTGFVKINGIMISPRNSNFCKTKYSYKLWFVILIHTDIYDTFILKHRLHFTKLNKYKTRRAIFKKISNPGNIFQLTWISWEIFKFVWIWSVGSLRLWLSSFSHSLPQ